jgi:hypothetical protein
MARARGFDKLLDQLEAALITSRALKLKSISDLLLLAFGEATQRMSAELVKVEKNIRKKGKRASSGRSSARGAR